MLRIPLGINSHSSTEGCVSIAEDRKKMADTPEWFVLLAVSNAPHILVTRNVGSDMLLRLCTKRTMCDYQLACNQSINQSINQPKWIHISNAGGHPCMSENSRNDHN